MVSKLEIIKLLAVAIAARYPGMTARASLAAARAAWAVGGLPGAMAAYAVATNPQRPQQIAVPGVGQVGVGLTPAETEVRRISQEFAAGAPPGGRPLPGTDIYPHEFLYPLGTKVVATVKRKSSAAQKAYNRAVKKGMTIIKESKEIGNKGAITDPRKAFKRATKAAKLVVKKGAVKTKDGSKAVVKLARRIRRLL